MKRLLITGAAGRLGRAARRHLAGMSEVLRISDVADMGPVAPNEEAVTADLADAEAVMALVEGCDGIVHLGGVSVEDTFEAILGANIRGVYNLYEAVLAHGKPRVFFASSNHAIGFHPVDRVLDADAPPMADSLYGASKVYGEQIAVLYHHKHGIESARVRIGSCFPEPGDQRMLTTWISERDLFALAERVFAVPVLGCPVVYGASDNAGRWWDNGKVGYLGWRPRDNTDAWVAAVEAAEPARPGDAPEVRYQGGGFAAAPIKRG